MLDVTAPGADSPLATNLFWAMFAWAVLAIGWSWRYRRLRVVTVIDGDTYVATDLRGRKRRLRLKGVDAVEKHQRLGPEATVFARQWLGSEWRTMTYHGRDRYNRWLVSIHDRRGGLDVALVQAGYAYALEGNWRLRWATARARLARRGVWGQLFREAPWQARKRTLWWARLRWLGGATRKAPRRERR